MINVISNNNSIIITDNDQNKVIVIQSTVSVVEIISQNYINTLSNT
jgi:hypothetical protein